MTILVEMILGDCTGRFLAALAVNLALVATVKSWMYIMAKVCNQILLTIRQELYTHIQKLDFAFFDSRPTGKILSRIIGDINSLKDVLSNCVTTLVPDGLTVIAVIVIMVCKNPALALASLLTLPFMAAATFILNTRRIRDGRFSERSRRI